MDKPARPLQTARKDAQQQSWQSYHPGPCSCRLKRTRKESRKQLGVKGYFNVKTKLAHMPYATIIQFLSLFGGQQQVLKLLKMLETVTDWL